LSQQITKAQHKEKSQSRSQARRQKILSVNTKLTYSHEHLRQRHPEALT
jgi:hypothetical protein